MGISVKLRVRRGLCISMWDQATVAGDPNSEALQEIRKATLGSREVTGPLLDRYVAVGVIGREGL